MALVINDRVKETSSTAGTGTLDLAGAVTGFVTFVAGIGDTNTTYYAIFEQGTVRWEVGLGTVGDATPDTLARTTVITNSSGNTDKIVFAGTLDVFGTLPASKTLYLDNSGVATAAAGIGTSANNLVQLNGSAQLPAVDGSLLTGTGLSWQAVKINSDSPVTSVSNEGYFLNTTAGVITINLPTSPSLGDEIRFIDYAGTWDTNNLTVGRNSHKIQGASADLVVATERAAFGLLYVDATQGWLLTEK
jgi:hypothetical protein